MVHDLAVVGFVDAVHLHRIRLVDQVEQRREGLAKIDATPAAVADVEHPGEFGVHGFPIMEVRAAPVDGLALRRFEAAFLDGYGAVLVADDSRSRKMGMALPKGIKKSLA